MPTASKVVNGREDVAPETRRRVMETLDRLGHVRRPRFDAGRAPGLVDLVVQTLDTSGAGAVLPEGSRRPTTRGWGWWCPRGRPGRGAAGRSAAGSTS
ncbi:hypothetical protein [Streptomyces sp. H51]|uniref:hypothetical protein n=1 Tax=Streptomyces sp. H51 TaxID=3111770 RepID=UPI003B6402FC